MMKTDFAYEIWADKYKRNNEKTIEDTFSRVAAAACEHEDGGRYHEFHNAFYDIMSSGYFMPAGRILASAGVDTSATLGNCYVSRTIEDSMSGIMAALNDACMTLRSGGGIGMDFSTLRPRSSEVRGLGHGATASGPVSFMSMWDTMCSTIMSAGARRGAMMAVLRVDHPDILEFIEAKRTAGRLTNFNVSVAVTDDFMKCVKAGLPFVLQFNGVGYRTIDARDLWNQIIRLTYENAEPGVIFIDAVNARNPIGTDEIIATSNPCGEQFLPPNGMCLLGSLNLTSFVVDPFIVRGSKFDRTKMRQVVGTAVRFLDNCLDISNYPLEAQRTEAMNKRRIGLGFMGLGDALIMLGMRYGSQEACKFVRMITANIQNAAYEASEKLAAEKGPYLIWNARHGTARRNSHLMSIQPTGTTSLISDNVSGGIEPVFALNYKRKVLQPDGSHKVSEVRSFAYQLAMEQNAPTDGPEWVTATELTPIEHLEMAAAAAHYVDSGISKTINCPADMSFEDFGAVYTAAHSLGMKGCTTYRPTENRGSVIFTEPAPEKTVAVTIDPAAMLPGDMVRELADKLIDAQNAGAQIVFDKPYDPKQPLEIDPAGFLGKPDRQIGKLPELALGDGLAKREPVLTGKTYKLKPSGAEHALYITINDRDGAPFEIFFNTKDASHYQWMTALSRMISAVFRKGGDVAFVADELLQVFDPKGGYIEPGVGYVPSLCSGIGKIIRQHCGPGFVDVVNLEPTTTPVTVAPQHATIPDCPRCQVGTLAYKEGCSQCLDCGYTKCG